MQRELTAAHTALPIVILGVNAAGEESGNSTICTGRTLPWLQDTAAEDVWGDWHAAWRDVVILDATNRKVTVYNLTIHDLSIAANYQALASLLRAAAAGTRANVVAGTGQ